MDKHALPGRVMNLNPSSIIRCQYIKPIIKVIGIQLKELQIVPKTSWNVTSTFLKQSCYQFEVSIYFFLRN